MTFQQKYRLVNAAVKMNAMAMVNSLPLDGSKELILRDYVKPQSHEQRKLMWGIRLAEIAQQAWIAGRQWPVEVWHEYFKEKFLPDGLIEGETLDGYIKWLDMPDGSRKMVGSTTKLTTKGQIVYMTQVEAFATQELGVQFSADRMAA
jgi:hypothetical protein